MYYLGQPGWQIELWSCPAHLVDVGRTYLLNERQSRCCQCQHPQQCKVASQDKVDKVLWENLEGDEEAKENCAADQRESQSILSSQPHFEQNSSHMSPADTRQRMLHHAYP